MAISLKRAAMLSAGAVFGTVLGISAATFAGPKTGGNADTYEQLVLFADVLSRVQNDYVEETDAGDLVERRP